MSIDGRGPSLSRSAQDRISALVSENSRLKDRVSTLEGVAQANADDRDSYMERCVEFQQRLDAAQARVNDLLVMYREQCQAKPNLYNAGALDAMGIVTQVLTDEFRTEQSA